MLLKEHRLPSYAISRIMKNGQRLGRGPIQVISCPAETNVSRAAFIVSTKVSKQATERNRIRRLLRQAMVRLLPLVPSCMDMVIVAKVNLADQKEEHVEGVLRSLLIHG